MGSVNQPHSTWEWDEIIVDRCYELDAIAKACETSPDILRV